MGEITKRCTNCGKFPFCDVAYERNTVCTNWVKRQVEMKLDSKKGCVFDFSKVDNHIPRID